MFTSGEENVQRVKCFKAAAVLAQDFKQCKQMLNMYPPSFIQFHPGSGRLVDGFLLGHVITSELVKVLDLGMQLKKKYIY